MVVFVFKQKTAYEMRISDWSSDVCSSDLWLWSQTEAWGIPIPTSRGAFGLPSCAASRASTVGTLFPASRRPQSRHTSVEDGRVLDTRARPCCDRKSVV